MCTDLSDDGRQITLLDSRRLFFTFILFLVLIYLFIDFANEFFNFLFSVQKQ